jgi:hypothetical protein
MANRYRVPLISTWRVGRGGQGRETVPVGVERTVLTAACGLLLFRLLRLEEMSPEFGPANLSVDQYGLDRVE